MGGYQNRISPSRYSKIYWLKVIDALPKLWKDAILKDKGNAKNLVISDHHIVRKSEICSLNNLTSKYC